MAETLPGGAKFDFRGATVHGSVFNETVFHRAVTLTHGLGAPPARQAALAQALEDLRAQLAALPDDQAALANEAAASAKAVVEAVRPGGETGRFRGAARALHGWAKEIGKVAVSAAVGALVKAAAEVRDWPPPDLG